MVVFADEFDVVVVGSGIAGLTAATSAVQAGMTVVLLEKTEEVGGSSAMSGGWFAFSGTGEQAAAGVDDSHGAFRDDLLEVGQHHNDGELVEAYLLHQRDAYEWLTGLGVRFGELGISAGMSVPRGVLTDIRAVLARLHTVFGELGGATRLNHRARRLVRGADGRVGAVVVATGQGERCYVGRRAVVLATGGFSRSSRLLRTFAPEQLRAIPHGGPGNTGDGLLMAWRLGAGMADMAFVSGTYGSHPDTGDRVHELLSAYYSGAVIVNRQGRRFVDESLDYKTLGRAVLAQPEGLGFQVFDAGVRALSRRGVPLKDIDTLEEIGHVHRAETLPALAEEAGIDGAGLVASIDAYNAAVDGERADVVGRTRLCNGQGDLRRIDEPPFFAYPAKTLMTTTYCGLTITPRAEVLDVDGNVIDGLYAIGEVTGGFHGAAYMTGTSLGKGTVFGRIVAGHIAARH
ncbi:FAD-dependent oxidoreductase [Pseudonocardia nematodicida]|uniref:FAD-dependent oxidoreductase n=1 Tax=Pseudonocardia nematodicida TaxID=1206997 RepID=A0ABV1K5J4_9PSEU